MLYKIKEERRRKLTDLHNKKNKEEGFLEGHSRTPERDVEPTKEYNNRSRSRFDHQRMNNQVEDKSTNRKSRGKFAGIAKRGAPTEPTMHKYIHEMTSDEIEKNKLEQTLMRVQVQRDNVSLSLLIG